LKRRYFNYSNKSSSFYFLKLKISKISVVHGANSSIKMPSADPQPPQLKYTPMKYSGSLDAHPFVEVTPIIGREYASLKIKDILASPNSAQQIRDLAVIISERGVVFFRANQEDLSVEELKHFTDLVARLSGRPEENGLHIHPLYRDPGNCPMGNGETDENMYVGFAFRLDGVDQEA
jgi:hypothetical protein